MMRWIIGSSLKLRFLVVAFAAGMMYFGVSAVQSMAVDVFPEFAPPRVEVQTPSLGLSASEVEELVTVPLEQSLQGVDGLDTIRSKSVPALSSIELIFESGTDLLTARQLVQEQIETITPTLPTWSSPPFMIQPLSATSRVMKIGLTSEDRSLIEMSMVSYWTIRERLLRVPGVANVAIWGERLQMMQVQVQPERLQAEGVTLDHVMEVTANALDAGLLQYSNGALIGTGGFVETPNQRFNVRHVLSISTPEDLAQVSLGRGKDGQRLQLSDVAKVVEDHQPLIGDAVINDGPGLMLIVEKLPWGNTLEVTRGVEDALAELAPGLQGIEIDTTIFRPATFVEMSIDNLTTAMILGFLLVVLIIGAFLFEWRVALISLVTIPLSLTAAGLVLYWRGTSVNTMILAGLVIALGAIVDDAIIDVENIVRRLRQHRREGTGRSTASVILEASLEVRGPIIYATFIIVAAALPVFFLEGLTGAFFRPLALSYTLAVVASLLVALTVTPAMCLMLLRGSKVERRESPLVRWLQGGYERVVKRLILRPAAAYATVAVVAVAGIATVPQLGQSLLPSFKETDFLMHWVTDPSTSQPEETRVTTLASKELRAIPGVRNFGAHIGQALLADEVVGVNFGENWISIDPEVDYDETLASIQGVVDGYPGIYRDVQTYLKERIREVLTGTGEAVVVRIYGPDLEVLRAKADEVQEVLASVDGLIEEHVDLQVDVPQIQVEVDLETAQAYGVKPGDVRRAAGALLAGEEVGDLYRGGKAYDVQVWSTPQTRNSLTSVEQLPIDTPEDGQVMLGELADVQVRATPNTIERDNGSRRIDVAANVSGGDLGAIVDEVEDRLDSVELPLGYHSEMLGEDTERQAATNQLLLYSAGALLAIFILLQVSFGSWRLSLLSFLTLPMALVGGVLAVYFSDGILSLGSLVGFLTVFGIAARNGILLINHYQYLERHEGEPFGPALVIRGSRERLSPILMTSLATGLALVPLVVAGQIPGHEVEHPLAVVILGGLVTSTLLNLFVVPALYLRFARPRSRSSRPVEGLPQPA
ncbi:MAG: efflux RND transporter permease subunit [Actinomycetota bacterium]|nr:efflux RND transporter permease subunit [Actinomycetota bacterium]